MDRGTMKRAKVAGRRGVRRRVRVKFGLSRRVRFLRKRGGIREDDTGRRLFCLL